MTPAHQIYGGRIQLKDGVTIVGDCWRTCVAMILDLEPLDVPHFVQDKYNDPETEHPEGLGLEGAWARATREWLNERGLTIDFYNGGIRRGYEGYAIATGPSPRGDWMHAVVVWVWPSDTGDYLNMGYVADPHPDETFLAGPPVDFAIIKEMV